MPKQQKRRIVGAKKIPKSPLVTALNELVDTQHRWCTPSILPEQHRVSDEYDDVSVSARALGSLLQHDGYFGEAEKFAADAYDADRTFLSPHGSTGANAIMLRMLALERRDALVLVARNVHHSIINGLKMFSVDFRFLPNPRYDPHFEAILPPRIQDVMDGLSRYPEALAVIYTSPTYEGLVADTIGITHVVHESYPQVVVAVDEAWGGHLRFHDDLPEPAMRRPNGADIVIQSTHKMAGSLQQGALIHWLEARIDSIIMEEAYREYVTTSPSYHLLGSVDAAVRLLKAHGPTYLERSIDRSGKLRDKLRCNLPGLDILGVTTPPGYTPSGFDLTKTTLGLSQYEITGFELADRLEQNGVIVERAGLNSLVLVTTFQLPDEAVDRLVGAVTAILQGREVPQGTVKNLPRDPFGGGSGMQKMRPYAVVRYAKYLSRLVPLADAVDCIAAESVELYPPGIPVILEGYKVTRDAVNYLQAAQSNGARVVARDPYLKNLRVLGDPTQL